MKTAIKVSLYKTSWMVSLVALLSLPAFAQQCCLTFPANTPLNAFVTVYPDLNSSSLTTTPPAWFAVDVTNANEAIPIGVYPAWCVDESTFLPAIQITIPGEPYSGALISTCDASGLANLPTGHGGTPPVGPPPTVSLATWHEINYILNHKTGYYWWNVQVAISRLVGGPAPNDPALSNPASGYPPVDPTQVTNILNDANANAAKWTLPCGGTVGVIFVIPALTSGAVGSDDPTYTGSVQLIMLEVPCTCPTATCVGIIAVQGVAITPVTMVGSGGCGSPYTFTASGLPSGLIMSSGGTISGTPTVSGTVNFNYTVTVTDKCGNTGTANCTVTVLTPPSANCVTINAVQNVAITPVTMVGSGGCGGSYTFTATGLPAGVSMSSSGTISGTPTVNGRFSYTVTVKDSCGNTGTFNCSVTVNPPPSASCVTINAVQGVAITSVTMVGSGGCGGPYTFSATGLPAGLSMSTGGTISGTPTASGTFSYTVTVKDSCGNTGTFNCSVTVVCGLSSICGTVYADCDGSGDLSAGDVGFTNVVVTLKNAQGQVVATVKTDANGNYCFSNLPAGTYTVVVVQPSNCKQTAGTTTRHWKDNFGRTCWLDNDNYVHWKDSNNTDCWNASDGYMHWKDSSGRDCWKDRYGTTHSQSCNYVSCDACVNNTETVTLSCGEAKTDVDFAYTGTAPKTHVCISGPTRAKCGDTITYNCTVSNLGNVCFTGGCKVQICGHWFTCSNLGPGQNWTCTQNYTVQRGDLGTLNCNVTATCYLTGGGTVSDNSTCSTQVSWQ
jgi:hypothetical protein